MNALGIFLLSSLVFVVCAILEYSAVLFITGQVSEGTKGKEKDMPKTSFREIQNGKRSDLVARLRRSLMQPNAIGHNGVMDIEALNSVKFTLTSCFGNNQKMRRIDYIAFWVFLTSYAFFIFMYWSILSNNTNCVGESCKQSH